MERITITPRASGEVNADADADISTAGGTFEAPGEGLRLGHFVSSLFETTSTTSPMVSMPASSPSSKQILKWFSISTTKRELLDRIELEVAKKMGRLVDVDDGQMLLQNLSHIAENSCAVHDY